MEKKDVGEAMLLWLPHPSYTLKHITLKVSILF